MLKVILVGMGPLGCGMAGYFRSRKSISLVGAVDADPEKIGMSVGELSGTPEFNGITVEGGISSVAKRTGADAVILATVSSLSKLIPQVEEAASAKIDIVSTCEELSYPWRTQPENARRIDEIAKTNGVAVLGTGVNPGFLMDYLPSVMTGICREIKRVTVSRIQDASHRRISFRKKIGAGLSAMEFEEMRIKGVLRHVGLVESLHMLAAGAGWTLDKTDETLHPVIGDSDVRLGDEIIEKGMALGVEQRASGYLSGEEVVNLVFRAAVGEKSPRDSIVIEGIPSFTALVPEGINGDIATCAVTVNAVKSVAGASPGLKTMLDIPAVSYSP